jgi:Tol biopolymer transport system component/predicted Ser/Thr protein kinase
MGEVYKARDTRLDRIVAVKVLPENVASRPGFRQRFEREARTISSLSHPHICPLYDVGHQDGTDFLVMEYLEGESIAQRLKKGPLPLDQALRYAVEIAASLDHAHRHGVVHRDLKPGNVMLTKLGAKVLDFGLAKVRAGVQERTASSAVATAMVTEAITAHGAIVGTLQYMAPEQLEGKEADARSDIFAFGAVVYEMATGRRAFEGASPASLIAAILEHEPAPLASDGPTGALSQPLDHVVRVCLAKDPDERWQSAGDLMRELKWISSADFQRGVQTAPAPAGARPSRKRTLLAAAIGAAVMLAALGAYLLQRKSGIPGPTIALGRTTQVTFEAGIELDPALSPDGKLIACAAGTIGQTHIYVRQLGSPRRIPLAPGVPGFHRWPQWSPDGSRIAFFAVDLHTGVQTIWLVPALGGIAKRLIEEPADAGLCCPAWSPDGARIAYASQNAVWVHTLAQGQAAKIAEHPFPTHSLAWSPDGARIAYVVENIDFLFGMPYLGNIAPSAVWVTGTAGGQAVQVTDRVHLNTSPTWMPDSKRLLFISNQSGRRDVYQLSLRDSGQPAGPPALLTTGLNALNISLSRDGSKLAYTVLNHEANIWSIPIPARPPVSASAATPVTTGSQAIEGIAVSRDGQWLAFDSNRSGNQDVYRMPLAGGEIEQLTINPADDFLPSWSPDGKEIVFYSWRNGNRDLFLMAADGSSERQLTSEPGHEYYPDWSADGQQIVFWNFQSPKDSLALLTRTAGGTGWSAPRDIVASHTGHPRWSPDGRLIAYAGAGTVRVVSPQGGEPRVLVGKSGLPTAGFVAWSRDSQTVYYKAYDAEAHSSIWSVSTAGGTPTLLVKFDDPAQQSQRVEFAAGADRFFFTIGHYESDIFVMEAAKER